MPEGRCAASSSLLPRSDPKLEYYLGKRQLNSWFPATKLKETSAHEATRARCDANAHPQYGVDPSRLYAVALDRQLGIAFNHCAAAIARAPCSYGPDFSDQYRRAASYIDLKGEKPADLPVHAPTKYEPVVNLEVAKIRGLTMPPTLLTRADEVIE
jgi:hypothetical protein